MPSKTPLLTPALVVAAALWATQAAAERHSFEMGDGLAHLGSDSRRHGRLRPFPGAGAVRVSPELWFDEGGPARPVGGVVGFPRRLLLDRATASMRLSGARSLLDGAGSGAGVVIGIVDSGVDFTHPDLREPDGSTRMAWWIEFGSGPYGFHPELESDYGCTGTTLRCGILGRAELDLLLEGVELPSPSGETVRPPEDTLGHGTLVASLALGNGQSSADFAGVAPEATLIGARVATTTAVVEDLDILLATRFVFERADELDMPAVVNLSLGGDIGPHDGSSTLERGLSEWILGTKGRAIVVAAGNSGTLTTASPPYPAPFGIHTEVHVPEGSVVRVPIVFPASDAENAVVYCWIATAPGDRLRVGIEEGNGVRVLPFVDEGDLASASDGERRATIAHHVAADLELSDTDRGIVVKLSGPIVANSVFGLLLEGEATVDLWLQSEGDLAPEAGRGRALFPAATRERTVNIPATSSSVIAVGATLNRSRWTSFGDSVHLSAFDPELEFQVGSSMPFSSAGPSLSGALKPDLVAPGGVIVGALARGAEAIQDGRLNTGSMFGLTPLCSALGCAQVNDAYGVAAGTSMAAPLVSGAAALLLEKNPNLDHRSLRALLWAGAHRTGGSDAQSGAGLLDIETMFRALALDTATDSRCRPSKQSWLSFGESFVRPGAEIPLPVLLHLRDSEDRPCDVNAELLGVEVANGTLTAPFTREAGGLLRASLRAPQGSAGQRLVIRVQPNEGSSVVGSIPIAVDSSVNENGVSVRGGCSMPGRPLGAWLWGPTIVLLFAGLTRSGLVSPRSCRPRGARRTAR